MIFDTLNICVTTVDKGDQWFTYSFEELRTVLRKHSKIVLGNDKPTTNEDIFEYVQTFRLNLLKYDTPLVMMTATKMVVYYKPQLVSVEMFIEGGEYDL